MLISLLISLLVSSAVTLRRDKSILFSSIVLNAVTLIRDKSILFSRIVLTDLLFASFLALNNLFIKTLENLNLVAYVNTSSFSKNRNLPNSKGHVNPSNIIISSASYSTYYGVSTLHYFKSYFSLYFFFLNYYVI